jgi:hypothetical protein
MDYTKEKAERRLVAALRGSRIAGHKPMTNIPKKRVRRHRASLGSSI